MNKLKMTFWTIALGLSLIGLGMLSHYLAGNEASATALIPAFVGSGFLLIGFVSFSAKLRKHAIHGGLVLALLLGSLTLYMAVNELFKPADKSSARKLFAFETTAVLCTTYIAIGVNSFLNARKARREVNKLNRAAEKAEAAAEM